MKSVLWCRRCNAIRVVEYEDLWKSESYLCEKCQKNDTGEEK